MSDDPLVDCPDCGEAALQKQLSAPKFRLKGSGWYETELTGIFIGRHGEVINTDSIRIDMDGGRVILAQKGSGEAQTNKNNWQKELEFARNRKS